VLCGAPLCRQWSRRPIGRRLLSANLNPNQLEPNTHYCTDTNYLFGGGEPCSLRFNALKHRDSLHLFSICSPPTLLQPSTNCSPTSSRLLAHLPQCSSCGPAPKPSLIFHALSADSSPFVQHEQDC